MEMIPHVIVIITRGTIHCVSEEKLHMILAKDAEKQSNEGLLKLQNMRQAFDFNLYLQSICYHCGILIVLINTFVVLSIHWSIKYLKK